MKALVDPSACYQGSLLEDGFVPVIAQKTQGIKYAGSKLKLLPRIQELIAKTKVTSVLDGFSGSTRVSQALAKSGYQVFSGDASIWSKTFATCYLKNTKSRAYYSELFEHLNSLEPVDGWFTENYGGDVTESPKGNAIQSDGLKKPWQRKNTRKLDSVRLEIDRLNLDEVEKSVALSGLILALDRVDSTLGHFSSYLKKWSARSYKDLCLEIPLIWENSMHHDVFAGDVFSYLDKAEYDLAYFDPPYGSNNEKMPPSRVRYSAYYHVWTSIVANDKPDLFGKVLRRSDTADAIAASVFEEFRRSKTGKFIAVDAIERLLREAQCEWIVLSYSSGGRATSAEIAEVIASVGELVEVVEIDYRKNIMASMSWTNEWLRDAEEPNREFMFLVRK